MVMVSSDFGGKPDKKNFFLEKKKLGGLVKS
jgi:hypothetical protein